MPSKVFMPSAAVDFGSNDNSSIMGGSDSKASGSSSSSALLSVHEKCPMGTPTFFLQVCRLAFCRPVSSGQYPFCVGQQTETAWLYELTQRTQLSHATLVAALYYLGLITLQSLQAGEMVTACNMSTGTIRHSRGPPSVVESMTPEQQQLPNSVESLKAAMRQAVNCPHCLMTGCLVVACKVIQPSITTLKDLPSIIANAAGVPVEIARFCELLILDRLQEHILIAEPVIVQLLAQYAEDPIRQHWWKSESNSCPCSRQHSVNPGLNDISFVEYELYSLHSKFRHLTTDGLQHI